ncbi:MAG: hypothetical protein LQ339_008691 [Xanthoria mediterranea]|nr:MAG: hypothetical protein LQ339_008691 [Xanthoria mediterranea]
MPTNTGSAISTFISHLRLLNLDQLEDWPVLTEDLFAPKHVREKQKQRIRCVEWTLYRLFESWSPKDAKNKLQPFFPPYESLRSLNLRAALFRCLNDLKKDGILGKEIVIRKSMFDDCRGDRFEELLSSFSTIVLQKVVRTQPGGATTITGRLATRQTLSRREQASLSPLAVAHQGALKALLERKKRLKERYANLRPVLEAKEQELLKRVDDLALADAKHPLEPVSDRAVQEIRRQFDEKWQGDRQWIKTLVEADSQDVLDPLLDTPFSTLWSHVEHGTISQVGGVLQQSLLQDLTQRVRTQQDRLSHWQSIQQALINSRPKSPSKINGQTTPHRNRALQSPLKFSYTQQYPGNEAVSKGLISPEMKTQHRQLLDYSHRTKQSGSTPSRKLEFKQRRREWVDPVVVWPEDQCLAEQTLWSDQLEFNPSTATTPTKETVLVDKQLDPTSQDVALRQGEVSIDPSGGTFTPSRFQLKRATADWEDVENKAPLPQLDEQQSVEQCQQVSPTPTQNGNSYIDTHSSSSSGQAPVCDIHSTSHEDMLAQQIIAATMNSEASPVKPKISLMERTRQSMAFSQTDSLLPDPIFDPPPTHVLAMKAPDKNQYTTLNRSSSLVERTRRSMSLLPASLPSKGSHPSGHSRRQSRQYPTNQFETPKKQLEDLKEMTPPDVLFSPETDYASVFKSRPKIATSPSISPSLTKKGQWVEDGGEDVGPV